MTLKEFLSMFTTDRSYVRVTDAGQKDWQGFATDCPAELSDEKVLGVDPEMVKRPDGLTVLGMSVLIL